MRDYDLLSVVVFVYADQNHFSYIPTELRWFKTASCLENVRMEAIDAGEIPLTLILDRLLSDSGLKELVGPKRVACFVLARAGLVRGFFEALIDNVDTIDNTLRDNVAFIVFHGKQSSLYARPRPQRYKSPSSELEADRYHRDLKFSINGLSRSDGKSLHAIGRDDKWIRFDDDLMRRVRERQAGIEIGGFESASERATDLLIERFDIAEVDLPGILFVDGENATRHLFVALDRDEPMKSLHLKVLAPLADEFRRVTPYFATLGQKQRPQRTLDSLELRRTDLGLKQAELEAIDVVIASAIKAHGLSDAEVAQNASKLGDLQALDQAFEAARTLEERIALIPAEDPIGKEIGALIKSRDALLELLNQGKNDVTFKKELHSFRGKIGGLCKAFRSDLATRLAQSTEDVNNVVPGALLDRRARLRKDVESTFTWINELREKSGPAALELEALNRAAMRLRRDVLSLGYTASFVDANRADSLTVVERVLKNAAQPAGISEGALVATAETKKDTSAEDRFLSKLGVYFGGIQTLIAVITAIPVLITFLVFLNQTFKPVAPARIPHSVTASQAKPVTSAKYPVATLDSERATGDQVWQEIKKDPEADAAEWGRVKGTGLEKFEATGCKFPNVAVVHLHAFGRDKEDERMLFKGLAAIYARSPLTRYVIYSSTFGVPDPKDPTIVVTDTSENLKPKMDAITHGASAGDNDPVYGKILARTTYVVWPQPDRLKLKNKEQMREAVRTAGTQNDPPMSKTSNLCS